MPDTFTANYGWTKPAVGGDSGTWGGLLNTDLDNIDSTVHTISGVANAALPASSYTSASVLSTLNGASGTIAIGLMPSGINAATLNSQAASYYLNASNLNAGTVSTARLGSGSPTSSNFLRGDQTWATVAAANVSGLATSATTDATNASNISAGTLAAARLPTSVPILGGGHTGCNVTYSTSAPSGGADGDLWLQYT